VTAISAGTEGLLWRGLWPTGVALDATIGEYQRPMTYPVRYGYASVGTIKEVGSGVDPRLVGRNAFSFTGHRSWSAVAVNQIQVLPEGMAAEDGVFLAAMETALTLVQDAAPVVGETVGIWGLGTIGVLAAQLLKDFDLYAWDPVSFRRQQAASQGVLRLEVPPPGLCDVALELSGNPAALAQALAATRFSGRVVVGSWYGAKAVEVPLGMDFHRSRIQVHSSQVSSLNPLLSGRWTKERRLATALHYVTRLKPSGLVTHLFSLDQAEAAYQQACESPETGGQVLFTYP
jgi:2-desacetyl-2-hydroxyethyl bacteriochlorophyllide A dehydrogenase